MPTFHHEILIASPIETVFATLADVKTHAQWQEGLLRSEGDEQDYAHVGAKGFEVREMFGREVRFPYEISVYESSQRWGFRTLSGAVRPSAIISLSSQKDGPLIQSELTVPGVLGFLLGPMLLSQQRKNYVRLKHSLEVSTQPG